MLRFLLDPYTNRRCAWCRGHLKVWQRKFCRRCWLGHFDFWIEGQ